MIACLYGWGAAPFVEPVVADLQESAARRRARVLALTVEAAVATPSRWRDVERAYILPFDVPLQLPPGLPMTAGPLVRALFPHAEILNSMAAHELCWDKGATTQRLLDRGVSMPATLITSLPEEARAFIAQHRHTILKEPRSCGGHGHLVVFPDDGGTVVGETRGRRYAIELQSTGAGRKLSQGILTCSPPFYLQRLVCDVRRGGVLAPAQIVRAYIVDRQIAFWTELYRDRVRRLSDFIINAAAGAKYRFLPEVSEAAHKIARRAAEVLDVRVGVVDLIRAGSEGPDVLDVDTDGHHMMIDRGFKYVPDFRPAFDLEDYIAETLTAPALQPNRRLV